MPSLCNDSKKYAFENIVGKVENAGKEALKETNIVNTTASFALKGCFTFIGHFNALKQIT